MLDLIRALLLLALDRAEVAPKPAKIEAPTSRRLGCWGCALLAVAGLCSCCGLGWLLNSIGG